MTQVYEKHLWGGGDVDFYSGEGSHHPHLVEPYLKVISDFLLSFENSISVCDLGCGDFNIGKELVDYTCKYIGVDIVPALIARNEQLFIQDQLSFQCVDIAKDNLPMADCAILRQVLQHLSNAEVKQVVDKLNQYPYVLLTEHIPDGDFEPNLDIISGQGIRLKKKSGIDLLKPPFNLMVQDQKELLRLPLEKGKGKIVTILYQLH